MSQEQKKPVSASDLTALLAILAGELKPTKDQRVLLLELAVKVGVCGLYENYKADVLAAFTLDELQEIANSTKQFQSFTVENIYRAALYS